MNVTGRLEIEVSSADEWHMAFDYADGLGLTVHSVGVYGTWWGAAQKKNLTPEAVNVVGVESVGPGDYFELEVNAEKGRYEPFTGEHEDNGSVIIEFVGHGFDD